MTFYHPSEIKIQNFHSVRKMKHYQTQMDNEKLMFLYESTKTIFYFIPIKKLVKTRTDFETDMST